MAIQITPLLSIADSGEPSVSVNDAVERIRLDVPAAVYSKAQAERVLVRLGATPTQARSRLRLCGALEG